MQQAITFDSLARLLAVSSIDAYKTYISPKKGFSCAHRMLHGDESCSDYVRRMFSSENFMAAVQLSRSRFQNCVAANKTLKATQSTSGCIILPCCLPI